MPQKFSFQDEYENAYTLAVVNVKFNYVFKLEDGKPVKIKELREHFYENGFCVDGVRYVRYKRSAGSSREGKCLFIDERLFVPDYQSTFTEEVVSVEIEDGKLAALRKKYARPAAVLFVCLGNFTFALFRQ